MRRHPLVARRLRTCRPLPNRSAPHEGPCAVERRVGGDQQSGDARHHRGCLRRAAVQAVCLCGSRWVRSDLARRSGFSAVDSVVEDAELNAHPPTEMSPLTLEKSDRARLGVTAPLFVPPSDSTEMIGGRMPSAGSAPDSSSVRPTTSATPSAQRPERRFHPNRSRRSQSCSTAPKCCQSTRRTTERFLHWSARSPRRTTERLPVWARSNSCESSFVGVHTSVPVASSSTPGPQVRPAHTRPPVLALTIPFWMLRLTTSGTSMRSAGSPAVIRWARSSMASSRSPLATCPHRTARERRSGC